MFKIESLSAKYESVGNYGDEEERGDLPLNRQKVRP